MPAFPLPDSRKGGEARGLPSTASKPFATEEEM